jgi:hypothetical protein
VKAPNKTKPTNISPASFIKTLPVQQRRDAEELMAMMLEITGEPPKMWGSSIVGFGTIHFLYNSGREGDICLVGFSARKTSLVLYLGEALQDRSLMDRLGKHTRGKGCLYIRTLDDIDPDVLRTLVVKTVEIGRRRCRS